MSVPRILPLVGLAIGGVIAVNALSGAERLPDLLTGARAFAEEAAGATKLTKGDPKPEATPAPTLPPAAKPAAVCAPTAAELAKEAGLSPAELRILQNLGARRGQLDQREQDMDVQLALLAAAEAKLDAKVKAMNTLKTEVQGLLKAGDAQQEAETLRMVKVFESMKPKAAAERLTVLDDAVRLPIAAKMKERSLSAVLAQMPPDEAKKLTESLSRRFAAIQALAAAAKAPPPVAAPTAATPPPIQQAQAETTTLNKAKPAAKPSVKRAAAKAPARKKVPPTKQAAAKKAAPVEQAAALPAKPIPYTPPATAAPEKKAG